MLVKVRYSSRWTVPVLVALQQMEVGPWSFHRLLLWRFRMGCDGLQCLPLLESNPSLHWGGAPRSKQFVPVAFMCSDVNDNVLGLSKVFPGSLPKRIKSAV